MTTDLDEFVSAYIECGLWATTDEDGEPLDRHYGPNDLSSVTKTSMEAEARCFFEANRELIEAGFDGLGAQGPFSKFARAGHDLWLTRSRSGAGYWDGDWPEPAAALLTEASHRLGELCLYVGDDGRVHCCKG
jgi:hypothetical protein